MLFPGPEFSAPFIMHVLWLPTETFQPGCHRDPVDPVTLGSQSRSARMLSQNDI